MTTPSAPLAAPDLTQLRVQIDDWSRQLGFQRCGVSTARLDDDEAHLQRWLDCGMHGTMDYMQRHGSKRSHPAELVPGTISVISVRIDYLPTDSATSQRVLDNPQLGYVSRYALGRDYHKLLRARLQKLASRIAGAIGPFGYRAYVDSAPVLEKALARNAGLGWIGKHSNLIDTKTGSWFFLGELFTDLPLTPDAPEIGNYCGTCTRCINACPTGAIVGPYRIDARLCISYLTIELQGAIPEALRPLIGNRIYGCDDCQLACPWNKFATLSAEPDFRSRHALDASSLVTLMGWTEAEFLSRTEGSAIRRIGYLRWLRNVAVALGNAPKSEAACVALIAYQDHADAMVREHVQWALAQQQSNQSARTEQNPQAKKTLSENQRG